MGKKKNRMGVNHISIELDNARLTEREERIIMFESFVDCLDLFRPEIQRRFEEIDGVTGCHVGYRAKGFIISVETKYPELRPTFIIEYKYIYLDLVDGPNRMEASPIVNHLSGEVARCLMQTEEAIRNMAGAFDSMDKGNMTISAVKQEIEDTQKRIAAMINDLQDRTGVVIEDVDVVHLISDTNGRCVAVAIRLVAYLETTDHNLT